MTTNPPSGIRSVSFYRDSQGCCCDRCGTFIKNVACVSYKDGTTQRYGSECIDKILSGDTSLQALWKKNARLLKKWQGYLDILSRPESDLPRGHEYYGSGLFMVADADGQDICCPELTCSIWQGIIGPQPLTLATQGAFQFHPIYDVDKNHSSDRYNQSSTANGPQEFVRKAHASLDGKKLWLRAEIDRIGAFLARILAKGLVNPGA